MFIKASIRGGYRAAAKYLSDQGKNEVSKLISISDPDAKNLEEAFHNMWQVASTTKAEKPLFHFSINPFKDERLTKQQVNRIAEAYTAKCGMDIKDHQHVIVEHIKNGRQHFHVILNRVSERTGKAIDPGLYKKKAKECAREMEKELGLKILVPSKARKTHTPRIKGGSHVHKKRRLSTPTYIKPSREAFRQAAQLTTNRRKKKHLNLPTRLKPNLIHIANAELLAWAWEQKRVDILATFGIILPEDYEF